MSKGFKITLVVLGMVPSILMLPLLILGLGLSGPTEPSGYIFGLSILFQLISGSSIIRSLKNDLAPRIVDKVVYLVPFVILLFAILYAIIIK